MWDGLHPDKIIRLEKNAGYDIKEIVFILKRRKEFVSQPSEKFLPKTVAGWYSALR
jgi:hypothetical protein